MTNKKEVPESIGEAFPAEQDRLIELIQQYAEIGESGRYGRMVISNALTTANAAMASGDPVRILMAYRLMESITE